MDITEVLKDLPEEKQTAILEAHTAAVEREKNAGISASRKKGEEVKKWMTEANKLKDTLKEHFDIDLNTVDDPVNAIAEKVKTFKTQTVNNSEHTATLKRLEKQLADMQAREAAATAKLREKTISETLSQALGDGFHAKDLLVKNLISSGEVRLTDDNEIVFVSDGDEFDIKSGVEQLRKKRPDLVKNISTPGSGGSGRGGNKDGNTKQISSADFFKLSPADRAKKMADGYKLT